MEDKNLEKSLCQFLGREVQPERLRETISLCKQIMQEQQIYQEEERTGFWCYLSDVFRFEGMGILGLQAAALIIICMMIGTLADVPEYIPTFMPLFGLAVIPVIFRSHFYGMGEIEAVTRASGAQIILAKLILAGAADLICITLLLYFEVHLQNSYENIGQMVLYCLVPYLVCMVAILRIVRLQKMERIPVCAGAILSSCICWGISAKAFPQLYETSATGLWLLAFVFFSFFFIKEIYFIVEMRKEGKMYGIID